jgi:hypothetical protein
MKNLLLVLSIFISSLTYSQNLIIDTFNCQGATTVLTKLVPIPPMLNCDSIISTHLFLVNFPQNPNDSIQTWWDIYSTGSSSTMSFNFPPYSFPQSGCYRYDLVFACPSGNLTILTSTFYVSTVGIDEITSTNKELVRITDMMGNPSEPTPNKILFYQYSDGTTKKVFIKE